MSFLSLAANSGQLSAISCQISAKSIGFELHSSPHLDLDLDLVVDLFKAGCFFEFFLVEKQVQHNLQD